MKTTFIRMLLVALAAFGISFISSGTNDITSYEAKLYIDDTTKNDTSKLRYPLRDKKPYDYNFKKSRFDLKDPDIFNKNTEYDPETNSYIEHEKLGDRELTPPKSKSFADYMREMKENEQQDYFRSKSKATNFVRSSGLVPNTVNVPDAVDRLFGPGLIDIKPSGSAEATFGGSYNVVKNPSIPVRQQKTGTPDFKIKMQVSVAGQIGDKLKINTNYDTDATFEFENQIKLNWEGGEDDILKKIELGNVSLPLNGSLITAGQSLFGIKAQTQFGKLMITTIATQQRGQTTETEVSGGAQITKFDIQANNYEANKHFFLGQFFKDQYDNALSLLPIVQSGAYINYIEVWVTNRNKSFNDNRNLIPYVDLGETNPFNPTLRDFGQVPPQTFNEGNILWNKILSDPALNSTTAVIDAFKTKYPNLDMKVGIDYNILTNARKLTEQEFTINRQLGYISLNQSLNNDEILGVSYEYTLNGAVYKVGQLSRDNPPGPSGQGNDLVVKMLKSTITNTRWPLWDLMMKNIYSLNTYNVQAQDFTLNVVYADDKTADLNYLPVAPTETNIFEKQLITVLNLDRMNKQTEAKPDGVFDLIDGITVNMLNGRIIFPVREPFGNFLRTKFKDPNGKDAGFYAYDALYDSTKWWAEQDVTHNKFFLRGSYRGSTTNIISLNAINVPQGSVKVTANGAALTENVDFTVDYNLGQVRIINEGIINSGAVIKVSSESNSLFTLQQKTLIGSRFDYTHSRNLLLGGTIMHMTERPLTPKVDIGQEPILNTIVGLDGTYNKDSRFLTKLIDAIPFIETKEKSSLMITAEVAKIFPHNAKTIGNTKGTSFLDDFEGAETPFDLKYVINWKYAATPQGQKDLFPETSSDSTNAFKRAKISFHTIDQTFSSSDKKYIPDYITGVDQSHPFVRAWGLKEVFPQLNIQMQQVNQLTTLDLVYHPKKRGVYNYNASPLDFKADGTFSKPQENWGGISRKIETNDFEAANIDYIEFWMMDPYCMNPNSTNKGQMFINIGSVSEDLNADNRRAVENGLPKNGTGIGLDSTRYGLIPQVAPQIQAFDNDNNSRPNQDKGLDGLNDNEERTFFNGYLDALRNNFGANSEIVKQAEIDPSTDDYQHYLDPTHSDIKKSILGRYENYNGMEGNSTLASLSTGQPLSASIFPDDEDLNRDQSMNFNEEYFQYKIDVSRDAFKVGSNFVTDSVRTIPNYIDGSGLPATVTWFQFKVPIRQFDKKVGGIQDFKSIRFMRLFLKGFEDSVVCRFGQMQLVRADWRRYLKNLSFPPGVGPNVDPNDETKFTISAVNIEKNSKRVPVPYVVPPGIVRETDPTQQNNVQMNEQALSLRACRLKKGDSRAAYKTLNVDIRNYKTMKMFIHAEGEDLVDGDVRAFVRIGTDLEKNYYQLEIPLKITHPGSTDVWAIWPQANELNVNLEDFQTVKLNRNNVTSDVTAYYQETINGNIVSVVGQPDLSNVRTIMLGLKNPLDVKNGKNEICPEVWFNELRMEDFVNSGGYAANARIVANLADFGKLNITGSYQSIGFGGVDKRLNQRNLNETITYDIQSNFELGKFFPVRAGITIPFFIGYNEIIINPKYNPLNPDVLLKTALKSAKDEATKKTLKENAQDFTSRYSYNFTNIKKNKIGGGKSHIYDIENFNVSYSYQKLFRRNQIIQENLVETYRASLGYNFMQSPKAWKPFKNLKGKALAPFTGFGLFFLPQSITARLDVDRRYSELQNRNNDNFKAIVPKLFDKTFMLTRVYGLNHNITNNLKFDYNSTITARVEEPTGSLESQAKKDTVWSNFKGMGKPNSFDQTINLTYNLPLSKLKWFNWIVITGRYTGSYNWRTAPPAAPIMGNTIQNSQVLSGNGQLNFSSFYNKIPLLKKANMPKGTGKKKKYDEDEPSTPKKKDDKKKKEDIELPSAARVTLKFLTMLKQVQLDLSSTNGISLPGYKRGLDYLGLNNKYNTPGLQFIAGFQDPNIRYKLAEGGHLSQNPLQINRFTQLEGLDIKGSGVLEPFDGFRINLTFERHYSLTTSSTFKYDTTIFPNQFIDQGYMEAGMFSITSNTWKTAFEKYDNENFHSDAYDQFQANRRIMANKVQAEELSSEVWQSKNYASKIGEIDKISRFPVGVDSNHQDVLMFAFLAAYQGKDANSFKADRFPLIPLPSWRVSWNGLSNIEFVKRLFTNITISHAYSSTTSVGNFNTNANYGRDTLLEGKNLTPKYQFTSISIIERLSPLIKVDLTLKSGMTFSFELKTDRSLNLTTSYKINEIHNKEYVFGMGFRKAGLILPFKINGRRPLLKNDLDFRMDFSLRDGYTITRDINSNILPAPNAGMQSISIRPTINYNITDALNFKAFYNRNINTPKTTQSYPTALTNFGISLRYTLQ